MWTLKEILDAALRMVPRGPNQGDTYDTYSEAIKVFNRRWYRLLSRYPWSFLTVHQTATVGPGTSGSPFVVTIGLPAVSVLSVVDATNRVRLLRVLPQELDAKDPGRITMGFPTHYAQLWAMSGTSPGSSIEIWPIPSSSVTLRMRVVRYEAPPSALDSMSGLPFDTALVYGVAADLTRQVASRSATENPRLAGVYMGIARELEAAYNEAVSELIETDSTRPSTPESAWESRDYYSYPYYPDPDGEWP